MDKVSQTILDFSGLLEMFKRLLFWVNQLELTERIVSILNAKTEAAFVRNPISLPNQMKSLRKEYLMQLKHYKSDPSYRIHSARARQLTEDLKNKEPVILVNAMET
jgi:hypothetical protein